MPDILFDVVIRGLLDVFTRDILKSQGYRTQFEIDYKERGQQRTGRT